MAIWDKLGYAPKEEYVLPEEKEEHGSTTADGYGGGTVPPKLDGYVPVKDLEENKRQLDGLFYSDINMDYKCRVFYSGEKKVMLCFLDGLTYTIVVDDMLMRPLIETPVTGIDDALDRVLPIHNLSVAEKGSQVVNAILEGDAVVIFDGDTRAILLDVKNYAKRQVGDAINEKVIKGPQNGFVENMRTNITLVRSVLRSPDLVSEIMPTGGDNNVKCAVMYRKGVAPESLVKRVKEKIQGISHVGFVLGGGMMEQLIREDGRCILPRTLQTERPDRTAAYLTQGHIAVVCDGYPYAMVLPITFFSLMQTSEDYFIHPVFATIERMIRYMSLFVSMLLPGIYVALVLYHQKMLPIEFILSSLASRQLIALPVFVEILMMSVVFELLREASVRVQSGINQTLGIVGGLILGQAAVSANLVSPIAIIVVATTGLSSFAIPDFSLQMAVYHMRFLFLLAAVLGGFWGILFLLVPLCAYLCSLTSYGVPYFAPVAPKTRGNRDIVIKGKVRRGGDIPDYVKTGGKQDE
ncbi:MAG: spore germination protein [Clostridiales bacterium]|nr:spore germination protein [Clostridiales bacterium]